MRPVLLSAAARWQAVKDVEVVEVAVSPRARDLLAQRGLHWTSCALEMAPSGTRLVFEASFVQEFGHVLLGAAHHLKPWGHPLDVLLAAGLNGGLAVQASSFQTMEVLAG